MTPGQTDANGPSAFSTGYLRTRVEVADGDRETAYVWSRGPGPHRPQPFTPVPSALGEALHAAPATGTVLAVGEVTADGRRYRTGGPLSAGHLLAASPDTGWTDLAALLHSTGRALRELHTRVPRTLAPGPPPGATRLARWLDDGRGPGAASRLYSLATARLGPARRQRARAWCAQLGTARETDVFLHGGPTLGALVPGPAPSAEQPTRATLLTGEELAWGPAEYDVGWLLGELAEFRLLHVSDPRHSASAHARDAVHALLAGYGHDGLHPLMAGRVAALRVLTHAHDFAAYVTWTDELRQHLDLAGCLLDSEGAEALSCGTWSVTDDRTGPPPALPTPTPPTHWERT